MRRANLKNVLIVALAVLISAPSVAFAAKEFFTDEEIDYIRDAQGLSHRVPALLELANIRLVTLGMKEKSKEDRELEKRISEIHDDLIGKPPPKPGKPGDKSKVPEISQPYLTDYTRVELLRGYIEALDEIKDDIDETYRQKLEVRGPLELLEKFCSASGPLLRRFQAHNDAELQAIDDTKSATEEALEGAEDGLKKVPKTEKTEKSVKP